MNAQVRNPQLPRLAHFALLLGLLGGGLAPNRACAFTATWTGPTTDNLWATSSNWGGSSPGAGDDAVFPDLGGYRSVDLGGSQAINSLQFNSSGFDSYLLYDGSLVLYNFIDQASSADATLDCALSFSGSVTLSGAGTGNVYLQGGLNGSPFINMTGGNYWLSGASSFAPVGMTVSGGYLHLFGTNQMSFGGNVQIQSGGILCVQGMPPSSVSAPAWNVQSGGTLKVGGTLGGPVSVASGGTFAAGCSPGSAYLLNDLFLNSGSTVEFELDTPNQVAGGSDYVSVTGTLGLNGTINIIALSNFGAGTYRLFDYSGSTFNGGVQLGQTPSGYTCTLDFSAPGQVNLLVSAVPPQSYDISVPEGLSLIANQLDHGSNTLDIIMTNAPDGTQVSKYDNVSGTWTQSRFSAASGTWSVPGLALNPGEGAFLQSPTNFLLTFTGTPHVPVLPVTVNGIALLSRQTNDVGSYDNIIGEAPPEGAALYQWVGGGYKAYSFAFGAWSPAVPSVAVGESVWIAPGGGALPPSLPPSYTLNISPGVNLIANQLDHGSNNINAVLPNVPDGTKLYVRNNADPNSEWSISVYSAASGTWLNGDSLTLSPGQGAFLDSPSAFSLTFTGQPHVPVLPVTIPDGQAYLLSDQLAETGTYQSIVGTAPPDGALVYRWNGSDFEGFMADSTSPTGWDDIIGNPAPEPSVRVGGALWISPSGTATPAILPHYAGLAVITPGAGSSLCSGSLMHITWSGGNPSWNVKILLADVPSWTVYTVITPSTPNSGSYNWTIPPTVPASTYLVYIQEVSALDWTYGPNFHIGPCATNNCVPPPAGLGLWLPFDETSGTTSGNLFPGGNPGTRINSPSVLSGYVANSLTFNGANQWVTVPDYPAIDPGPGQDFSIDAWVKRATNAPDSLPSIIVDKRDINTGRGYSLALSYGNLIFQMNDGSSYMNWRDTGFIPPDNQWHLVAVTVLRNQTNGGQFYLDGVPQASFDPTGFPGSLASAAPFQVAASPIGGNRPWLGALDEVEYFQRALLPTEVMAIFQAGSAGKCKCLPAPANLALWLPLDEPSGSTSANLAPSSNSGTHVNSPTVLSGYVANSLYFNGVNQYVAVPDYPAINPAAGQNFSMDGWVKRAANSPNSPPSVIMDKRDPNTGVGYSLALSYGNLIFQMNDGSGYTNWRDTGTIPPDNQWHLVAVTVIRNQTNGGRFYIDGVPKSSFNPTPYPGSLANTAPFEVAASAYGAGNVDWMGAIDEVEFFQRALSASEVLSLFNAGTAGKCKNGCGGSLVLNCATNRTVECGAQWSFTPPTAMEAGCSNITLIVLSTVTNLNTGKPCERDVTRTWFASDCCGHSNVCSQTISLVDTTAPVVQCPQGFSTDCSLPWSFTTPTAVDACSGTNVTITVLSTSTNGRCPYAITRTWQIADACGNSTQCSQTVVVGDFTPPLISCFQNKTVECGSGWSFDTPSATDACGGAPVTVSVLNTVTNGGACSQVITRTWVATNPCGVTNLCSQTVTTRDTTPPMLTCATNKTVECGSAWSFDPPSAIDACCGANVQVSVLNTTTNSGGLKCTTLATRTWVAVDCCGNTNTCSQVVTISDTTPPVFSPACVTNDTLLGGNNFTTPIPASPSPGLLARLHAAGVTSFKGFDDCKVNSYFAHTFTNLPHCLTSAILTVRMKPCGDACYNDTINLSFTSPSGVLQSNSWSRYLGSGNSVPGLDSDNWCGHGAGQVFVLDLSALPQPSGPALNLLPQLNSLGYLDFLSQDDSGIDSLELRLVSCCYQPDKSVPCGSQWTFDTPSATDGCCGANLTVTVFGTVTNGVCPKVVSRTWQATDCCGNSSFYSQNVTLLDTNPPVVYCPGPITRYVCSGSVRVYFSVYAYDACSGYRPVSCNPPSGSLFPPGTTIVSCTATDACGNVGFCSFPVTVVQQLLSGSILLGLPDCYKLPTEAAPKSAMLLAAHPGGCWKQFDSTQVNCALGASFMGLPANLVCGTLTVTMKPNCSDIPQNDSISLGLNTNASGVFTNGWTSYIGGGNPGPSLTPATWCGQNGCAQSFVLNLASLPAPGGNLLPLMNAQGKLDLYIQDDTTVDSARLDYCYCRVRPWWNGWDWNVVNADLAYGAGFASFSPLWSVGYRTNFSLSVAAGTTHGVQYGLAPLNLGATPAASLTVSAHTTLDPDADAIQLLGDGNGLIQFLQNKRRAKTSEATVVLSLRGLPIAQTNRPPIPGTSLLSLFGSSSLTRIQVTREGDTYSFTLDTPATALDFGGVLADQVDITFTQIDKSPETLLATVELDVDGLDELQLTSAATEVTGLFPQPTGQASAMAAGDQVSFGNLGSSGQDGFTLRTAPTNLLALVLSVAQNISSSGQSNGVLAGTFSGLIGPDELDVSHFTFSQSATGWDLSADLAGLGTTVFSIQVYNQGTLVTAQSLTGQPHVPVLPATCALQVSAQGTYQSFLWPQPQGFFLAGALYTGDELRLVPVAPDLTLNGITAAAIQVSGADLLTLSAATVNALPVWLLQTPVVSPDGMTIQWTGPAGGILNYAPAVTGPWTPVPGQSGNSALLPSPLTNGTPAQFFRVQSH